MILTISGFLISGQSRPLFVYFHSSFATILLYIRFRTWIVRVEGSHSDYKTTTTGHISVEKNNLVKGRNDGKSLGDEEKPVLEDVLEAPDLVVLFKIITGTVFEIRNRKMSRDEKNSGHGQVRSLQTDSSNLYFARLYYLIACQTF